VNPDFEVQLNNETLSFWEGLGNISIYRIVSDSINGTISNVLELSYNSMWDETPVGVTQNVCYN
jgi:hypothetical protein